MPNITNITINSTLAQMQSLIIKPSLNPSESSFLFYFKIFSFIIIVIITFSFGLLPIFFAKYRQTTILNYANPFAGGIFIGIGLFHLLPDASFDFEQYYQSKEGKASFIYGFPMSYFIAFLSYSFILYLEKVAFSTNETTKEENNVNINNADEKIDEEIIEPLLKEEEKNENANNIKEIKIDNDNDNDNDNMENNSDNELKELKDKNEKINYSLMYKRNRGK